MAYTINLTDGNVLATIADGTVNNSITSMTLVGKNYAGYGEFLNENFVHLLENSADTTAPASPLAGQLWWDKANNLLKVFNGSTFKTISAATSGNTAPAQNVTGDLWFDTVNQQLKVYNGSTFIVVGPAFTSAEGTAGAVPETIVDSGGTPHFVTSTYVNNVRVSITSKDASFIPSNNDIRTAFPVVYPGVTLASSGLSGSAVFAGTATNADTLDGINSTSFMRSDANTSTTGTVRVQNDTGVFVGTANTFNISTTATDTTLRNTVSDGNLILQANVSGNIHTVARVVGANGVFAVSNAATVGTTLTVTGNVTAGNISTASVTANANIVGANVIANAGVQGSTVTATGNVSGNNVSATAAVTAATVTATGNITGNFFIGNGSQLTGLSAAISVQKITNGTSEANVVAPNGNITFSVGGTANVMVIDSGTVYAGNVSVTNNIRTPGNGTANIGSAANQFGNVFAVQYNGSGVGLTALDASKLSTGFVPAARLSGTYNIAVTSANTAVSAATANTVTTAAQPNITSVGTLTGLSVNGNISAGNISALSLLISGGNVTAPNIVASNTVSLPSIIKTGTSGVGNIGSSTNAFNTVFATATSALYADVAERYAADAEYAPGTVVELGGDYEITMCTQDLSEHVFGVISTRPALLMNQQAGTDQTHPAVALIGRVPVMVAGVVQKNDRLVSAGQGLARAATPNEITPFNIIGRALESKLTAEPALVECVIRVNI